MVLFEWQIGTINNEKNTFLTGLGVILGGTTGGPWVELTAPNLPILNAY